MPLPEEKHHEALHSAPDQPSYEEPASDSGSDTLEFPEVPQVSVRPNANVASAPVSLTPSPSVPPPEVDLHSSSSFGVNRDVKQEVEEQSLADKDESRNSYGSVENKQFVPFISPPAVSSGSFSSRSSDSPPPHSRTRTEVEVTKTEADVDLQDVLVAAHAAAETAERAAAAARSAATLAQLRINELTKKNSEHILDSSSENPFYAGSINQSKSTEAERFTEQNVAGDNNGGTNHFEPHQHHESQGPDLSFSTFDKLKAEFDSSLPDEHVPEDKSSGHKPKILPSMDDDPYFSYPNLFTSQNSNPELHTHSSDHTHSSQ